MKKEHTMRDMTEGSVSRHLLAFALPLLVGSILQQLYNMVDSWVVGRFVSEAALAAVGMGFSVVFMFTALFMGMSSGTTVVISQYYGAGYLNKARDVVDTVYTFFTVSVVPISAFAMLITKPLLTLMRVQPDAFDDAYLYLMIVCGGLIGTIGYNINSGILQGVGNSRASLLFLAISAVMNIALDLLFVLVFHWNIAGVAIATIVSQLCSWLFGVAYINRNYRDAFTVRPFSFRFDRLIFRQIMGIGLPAGVQFAAISVGVMAVMSQVNAYGTSYMAGYNVGNKLDSIGFLPVQALAFAVTAFVGQNVGAKRDDRVKKGVILSLTYSIAWCAIIIAVLYPARFVASAFFTESQAAVEGSALLLRCILPFYPIFAVQYVLSNIMRGAGESVFPMVVVAGAQVFLRVPAVYLLAHFFGPDYMYYGFGVAWTFGAAAMVIYYRTGRWRRHLSMAEQAKLN